MKIKADTMARTAVLLLALVNQVLAILGKEVLPFTNDEIYQAVSLVGTIVASVVAWWKNNSFTKAAVDADEYLKKVKEGKLYE